MGLLLEHVIKTSLLESEESLGEFDESLLESYCKQVESRFKGQGKLDTNDFITYSRVRDYLDVKDSTRFPRKVS